MMNGINELQSLIHFLRIKPYNVVEKFNTVSYLHRRRRIVPI